MQSTSFHPLYWVIAKAQKDLYEAGIDELKAVYTGDKWGGKFLRAPEIYYKILEKGSNKLIPLKKVADVKFGIKTGANEFFHLNEKRIKEYGIETEYLVPLMKSPRDSKKLDLTTMKPAIYLFYCHKSKQALTGTNALKYIEWGESQGFHLRSSCSNRLVWYDLGERKFSNIVIPCGYGENFRFYKNNSVLVDKRLYEAYTENRNLIFSLNSVLTPFFLEIGARTGLGDGLMDLTVYEVANCLVVKIDKELSIKLPDRTIDSIFDELGFDGDAPIRHQLPQPKSDRKAIDDLVFDALGLSSEERQEVYWATAEMVKMRLDKAKTRN